MNTHRVAVFLFVLLASAAPWSLQAVTYYWDGGTVNANGQSDNANTSGQNWLNDGYWDNGSSSAALSSWTAGYSAVFGGSAGSQTINNNGAITIGNMTFIDTLAYTITGNVVNLSSTSTISNNSTTSISCVLAGAGCNLVKSGTGILTLSGINTYTGSTTIRNNSSVPLGATTSAGALILSNSLASATIQIGDYRTSSPPIGTNATLQLAVDNAFPATSSLIFDGKNSKNYSYLKMMGKTLTVAAITNIDNDAGSGQPAAIIQNTGTETGVGDGAIIISNTTYQSFSGRFRNHPGAGSGTLTVIKDGTGKLILNGYIQSGGIIISNGTLEISGPNAHAYIGGVNLKAGQLNINSTTALGDNTSTLTLSGGTTIDNTSGGDITVAKINPQNWNGSFTFAGSGNLNLGTGAVTLNATPQITVSASTLTVGGVISGAHGLTMLGSGTLTLSAANTYSGNTTNSVGTLRLGIANAISYGTGKGNVVVNGTLDLNSYSANINGLSGAGTVTTASGTPTLTVGNNDASGSFGGVIQNGSGVMSLTKTGSGTWYLSGANTYTGTTTVHNTTGVIVPAASANGGLVLSNTLASTVVRIGNYYQSGKTTLAGAHALLQLGADNPFAASAILIFDCTNNSRYSYLKLMGRTVTVAGLIQYDPESNSPNTGNTGAVIQNTGGEGSIGNGTLIVSNSTDQAFGGRVRNGSGSGTVSLTKDGTAKLALNGPLQMTGGITNRNGTLELSGSNTFSGGTALLAGQLNINSTNALGGNTSALTISGGTTLDNTSGGDITMANINPQNWNGNFTFGGSNSLNLGTGAVTLNASPQITVSANTLTVGGAISGPSYGITKSGPGKLVLMNANTYGGGTTVSSGTLALSGNGMLGASSGNVTINGAGAILDLGTLTRTNAMIALGDGMISNGTLAASSSFGLTNGTVTAVLADGSGTPAALTKAGSGTVTLSAANTYSGNTTNSLGTLKLGIATAIPSGSGKGNVVVNGTLDLNSYSANINGLSGAGTITTVGGTPTLTVGNNDASGSFGGVIQNGSGVMSLTKTGAGTWHLAGANTYSGTTTVHNTTGVISGAPSSVGGLVLSNTLASTVVRIGNYYQSGKTTPASAHALLQLGTDNPFVAAATLIFDCTNNSRFSYFKVMGHTVTVAGLIQYDPESSSPNTDFTGAVIQNTGNSDTSVGDGTLIVSNATEQTFGGRIRNASGLGSGKLSVVKDGPAKLTLNGPLSMTGGITNRNGTLELSGANIYLGGTTLLAGQLNINSTNALGGNTSTLTISGGTTLDNTSGGDITVANNNPQNWNGNFTFAGSTNLNLGSGAVTLNATPQITVSANTLTVGGAISGPGYGITKNGPGKLVLTNANTYGGGTTVSSGTLTVTTGGTLGTGGVTVSGGTLALQTSEAISNSVSLTVASGAKVDLASGVNETVNTLTLGGQQVWIGTWGGSDSAAENKWPDYFSGNGIITVTSGSKLWGSVYSIR